MQDWQETNGEHGQSYKETLLLYISLLDSDHTSFH